MDTDTPRNGAESSDRPSGTAEAEILAELKMISRQNLNNYGTKYAYNVAEAAAATGASEETIYAKVRAGVLAKVPNMGRLVLIPSSELQRVFDPQSADGRGRVES